MEFEFVKARKEIAALSENKEVEADILTGSAVTSSPEPQSPKNYEDK